MVSSDVSQASAAAERQTDEPYIPVEELAQRLDLPLTILLRRIEAGDVPARRAVSAAGSGWELRLSDLGIEPGADERADDADGGTELSDSASGAEASEPDAAPEAPVLGTPVEPATMFSGRVTRYERGTRGPRAEVAGMLIDSRELVSGLLDRWERTLEQRIHVEQRQRFEGELNARQNLVKQLQLELQTARAEHAAYAADRERRQLELERQMSDLQRELAAANEALSRRRGLFHRR